MASLEPGDLSFDYSTYELDNPDPSESSWKRKPVCADVRSGDSYDEPPWLLHADAGMEEGIAAKIDRKQSRPLRLKLLGFGKRRSELTLMQMEENRYVEYYSKFPDESEQQTRYKRMKEYGNDFYNERKPSCAEDLVECAATCMHSLTKRAVPTAKDDEELTLTKMEGTKYIEYYSKFPDESGQETRYRRMKEYGNDFYDERKPSCTENLVECTTMCMGSLTEECTKSCAGLCRGCCNHLPKLPDSLRKMRWKGLKMFFKSMKDVYRNTVIGSTVSDAEAYIQFFLTVGGLIGQVFSLKKQESSIGIAGLVLAAISAVFGIFNLVVHVYAWRLSTIAKWRKFVKENKIACSNPKLCCKKCKQFYRESREEVAQRVKRANERDNYDKEGEELNSDQDRIVQSAGDAESLDDADVCCCCCTCSSREVRDIDEDHFIENRLSSAGDRSKAVARVFDLVRVMFGEMLYYPRLILAIFEVIQAIYHLQQKEETAEIDFFKNHTTEYVLLGINIFQMLINVYFSRVFFLIALIYSIQKNYRKKKGCCTSWMKGSDILSWFCLFLIGQMFMQIVIIVMIAGMYAKEIRTSPDSSVAAEGQVIEVSISWSLWYMIIFGYIIIWLSSFAFLGLYYYSLQKFLVQMVVDVWKKKDFEEIVGIVKKREKEQHSKIEKKTNQSSTEEAVSNHEQSKTKEEVKDEHSVIEEGVEDEHSADKEALEKYIKRVNWESTILSPFSFPASVLFLAAVVYCFMCATSNLLDMDAAQFTKMINEFVANLVLTNPSDNCRLVDLTENQPKDEERCHWVYGWFVYLCYTWIVSMIINCHFVIVVITISLFPIPLVSFVVCHILVTLAKLCLKALKWAVLP